MSLPAYVHEAVAKVEGVATNVKADFLKLFGAVHAAKPAETGEAVEAPEPVEAVEEGDKP